MSKLKTFLWFDGQAEEAANFYTSIFKNSKLGKVARYPEGTPGKPGSAMTVEFHVEGQDFVGLNGGPQFKFSEAVSLAITCANQKELDYYWDELLEGGGKPSQCGWLKDKYGFSWQVVPRQMGSWANDPKTAGPVMAAVMKMVKLDIATLERAAKGA
jgi:predicted 3-demethylubiquinone-9 3-methyltransferase (glyoxalase superfamily)